MYYAVAAGNGHLGYCCSQDFKNLLPMFVVFSFLDKVLFILNQLVLGRFFASLSHIKLRIFRKAGI